MCGRLFFSLSLFSFTLTALAQPRFCIGGGLDHMSQAQVKACQSKMSEARAASANLGLPDNWHVVLVCDEQGWKDYAAFTNRDAADLMHAASDTDVEQHYTFLHASQFGSGTQTSAEQVMTTAIAAIPPTDLQLAQLHK